MAKTHVLSSKSHRIAAVSALSVGALLATVGVASAAGLAASAPNAAAPAKAVAASTGFPACGNADIKAGLGWGTQSQPEQAATLIFTNVSDQTCVLQGFPGLSIVVGKTTINAARVLSGFDINPLSGAYPVILAPGNAAYSVVEWSLHTNQSCYPSGTGELETTPPNTTATVVLSHLPAVGTQGICSGLSIIPVVPAAPGLPATA